MTPSDVGKRRGKVLSLHLHPDKGGLAMRSIPSFELVAEKGILGNTRYFGRVQRSSGLPSVRQVSLMERELIDQHAAELGLEQLPPGAVRANIETTGIDLVALIGQRIQIGEAHLLIREARTPCSKMDALCQGLRALMEGNRQGVLAQVVQSGTVRVGDEIMDL